MLFIFLPRSTASARLGIELRIKEDEHIESGLCDLQGLNPTAVEREHILVTHRRQRQVVFNESVAAAKRNDVFEVFGIEQSKITLTGESFIGNDRAVRVPESTFRQNVCEC